MKVPSNFSANIILSAIDDDGEDAGDDADDNDGDTNFDYDQGNKC